MKLSFFALFFTLIFALLLSTNSFAQEKVEEKQAPPANPIAPDWELATQDGKLVSYDDYKGKPLVLHFWGTWCPYCKKLHPALERIRAKYEDQGLAVVGITVNEPEGSNPQKVLKDRGINFLTLVEGDDVAENKFQVFGTPTTLFISPDGKILGSTMESNPNDPKFDQVAAYLVNLPRPSTAK